MDTKDKTAIKVLFLDMDGVMETIKYMSKVKHDTPVGIAGITQPTEAKEPYYMRDHEHCWQNDNPPCGIEGKHRCCLCTKPIPNEVNN